MVEQLLTFFRRRLAGFISKRVMVATSSHPFIERRRSERCFEFRLNRSSFPFLYERRTQGELLLSPSAYLEMAVAAVERITEPGPLFLADLEYRQLLILSEGESRVFQTLLAADGPTLYVHSRCSYGGVWTPHLRGRILPVHKRRAADGPTAEQIRGRCTQKIAGEAFYDARRGTGGAWSSSARVVEAIWRRDGEALAELEMPARFDGEGYRLHPVLLDACWMVLGAAAPGGGDGGFEGICLPQRLGQLRVYAPLEPRLRCHARLFVDWQDGGLTGDFRLWNAAGEVAAEMLGCRFRCVERIPRLSHDSKRALE